MEDGLNLLGAITAVIIYSSAILVFIFRLMRKTQYEYWAGFVEMLMLAPLMFIFIRSIGYQRPPLYYLQIALMSFWLIMELILDYILRINFRQIRWVLISYVILFFAGTGGMLGVVSYAGKGWIIAASVLFLIMALLTFIQRKVTGK